MAWVFFRYDITRHQGRAALTFLMQSSDTTLLYLALPAIAHALHLPVADMDMVILSYLAAIVLSTPVSDYLMKRWGEGSVYRLSLSLFVIAAVGCSLAESVWSLCFWRAVQGCGGALMLASARVMLLRGCARSEQARQLSQATAIGLLGTLLGPLLGALCLTSGSWRLIFLLMLPLCLPCFLLSGPDDETRERSSFDVGGYALLAPALAALLLLLAPTGRRLISMPGLAMLVAAIIGLAFCYVRHSGSRPDGVVRLSLLALRSYRVSLLGNVLFRLGFSSTPLMLSLLLRARSADGWPVESLALAAFSVGALGARVFSNALLARCGYRQLLTVGTLLCALLLMMVARVGSSGTLSVLLLLSLALGLCGSVLYCGLNTLAFHELDRETYGAGNSVLTLVQLLSMMLGISLAFTLLHASSLSPTGRYDLVFQSMGGCLLLSIPLFQQLEKCIGRTASA